jgi:hypothetical protein
VLHVAGADPPHQAPLVLLIVTDRKV